MAGAVRQGLPAVAISTLHQYPKLTLVTLKRVQVVHAMRNAAPTKNHRMAHPPYSPDLSPSDFFRFGAMKQAFAGHNFAAIDDLLMSVEASLRELSAEFLQTVFQEWIRQLQLDCDGGGEYVE
jgi:hypothetical protein